MTRDKIKQEIIEVAKTCRLNKLGAVITVELPAIYQIIDKIYDDFENRTCETCSKNISFECEIYNKLPFGQDEFGCIKWSER